MVSLKEVANLASVSLMTASRAINSPEQLRPETYQRVMQAIKSLNYVPDFAARKMRGHSTKTSTLAVLAWDTATTPFSVEILLSIEANCPRVWLEQLFSEPNLTRGQPTGA